MIKYEKKRSSLPLVSVIVNVYNEEKNIRKFLETIKKQDYPKTKIEIVVVDDASTDKTADIARKYGARIITSGYKNRERAKSIGMSKAKGKYLLLMDADVFLVSKTYIRDCIDLLLKYPKAIATQTIRWKYKKNDSYINRYCNLFGINDPFVMFLGKRGTLSAIEDKPPFSYKLIDRGKDYWVVRFDNKTLPTVGAQGYILSSRALKKTRWKPYFFHLDNALELVNKKEQVFILTTKSVYHDYVESFSEYIAKTARNIELYYQLKKYRSYTYDITFVRLLIAIVLMITVIIPLYQSIRGYSKIKDPAWFFHPVICLVLPLLYSMVTIKYYLLSSSSNYGTKA